MPPSTDTAAPAAATVARYPVLQPDGNTRHQVILVTGTDPDGKVRGFPLGYEDQAAALDSDLLA